MQQKKKANQARLHPSILPFLLVFIVTNSFAQTGYKIIYTLGGKMNGEQILICDKNQSIYGFINSLSRGVADAGQQQYPDGTVEAAMKKIDSSTPGVVAKLITYRRNLQTHKLIYVENHTPYYYTVEDDTLPKWVILNEFRKIKTFSCQKAQTTFRGRAFIAWFTREMPISAGPWKLAGLPGLILEATSADQKYKFLFSSCIAATIKPFQSGINPNKHNLSYSAYLKKVDEYFQDRVNKIHQEVLTGFMQRFGLVKTSPVSMDIQNIEKNLEKKYISVTEE